jgi:hypothetical protein
VKREGVGGWTLVDGPAAVPGPRRRSHGGGGQRHDARQPHGEALQVDPIRPKLKPPGIKRLKLDCELLLSTSAFEFKLRRYTTAHDRFGNACLEGGDQVLVRLLGRGLHSLTSQLNLSALHGIGGARRGCVARVKRVLGGVEGV